MVDFYSPKAKLIAEYDGRQHYTKEGLDADLNCDACLNDLGVLVLRYDNRQILTQTVAVLIQIERMVRERISESSQENPFPPLPLEKQGSDIIISINTKNILLQFKGFVVCYSNSDKDTFFISHL